jgi:hypothetical protein
MDVVDAFTTEIDTAQTSVAKTEAGEIRDAEVGNNAETELQMRKNTILVLVK